MHRREFLRATTSAFATLLLGGCSTHRGVANPDSPTKTAPTLIADKNGLLDLPPGFRYHVLSTLNETMNDGEPVPDKADGMGCFDLGDGTLALVRNHELHLEDPSNAFLSSGFGRKHNAILPGGTTHIIVDANTLDVRRQFRSLAGTVRNCAGGVTPWNSWLTCEEAPIRPDQPGGEGLSQEHGWVFEVPAGADGLVAATPLTAMGRFNHEAACVDPHSGIVYLTEDRNDGVLYRFIPSVPQRLHEGGRLQAMQMVGVPDSRNWGSMNIETGSQWPVQWVDIDEVSAPNDDLRRQASAKGATLIARGEGIHMGEREVYICSTSGGREKLGQIFRLVPGDAQTPDQVQLFFESQAANELNFGDNLTVAPNGHLIVCEDQYIDPVDNYLRGITQDGIAYPFARLRWNTELAGACFSPDGRYLFVNVYSPTRTLAITGPWSHLI
ncbi:MAG: alkaline phosphatase PhoX [Pseudomonadota bacterium]